MSFFKQLFSAPDVVKDTVDAVREAGDKIVFTEEEKSDANQKYLDWLLKFHEASSGSNLSRRLLALMFVGVFLFIILVVVYVILLGQMDVADKLLKLLNDTLVWPVSVIVIFYYGSGYVRDYVRGKSK